MSQIAWRPWSSEAFAEAREQDKPILLFITASWCQFCRAMDEQTYRNEAIAQYVTENFIPVRVDSDKRPDVNARYTQGGWPTTCLLTPEGDQLWGGTFMPADGMAQLLPQFLSEFRNNKQGLQQHVAQLREQVKQNNASPPLDENVQISPELPFGVLLAAKYEFDFAFGGFGHGGQKFPHHDAIELVMEVYARSIHGGQPDADLRLMLDRTLAGIAEGDLRDHGNGGFFRYAQTPDWRGPQVEKLLEDNALMTRVFARAFALTGEPRWKEIAEESINYMTEHLYDDEKGAWRGSQFADAEYYAQPLEERKEWNAPETDHNIFAGSCAQAARASIAWWAISGDEAALARAKRAVDFIRENLLEGDGPLRHFAPYSEADAEDAGGVPSGLLSDSARFAAACLDLYEAGQGTAYLDTAESVVAWVKANLEDVTGGGFFDSRPRPDAEGNLKVSARDVNDNMLLAETLCRLYLIFGDESYVRLAERQLKAFQPAVPQMGFFATGIALAIERLALPPLLVYVVGDPGDARTRALLQAAHAPYRFERLVQPLNPADEDDKDQIEQLGLNVGDEPQAFGMFVSAQGQSRLAPTTDPATLTETIRTATPEIVSIG